mgnify:CR=1 FL=1
MWSVNLNVHHANDKLAKKSAYSDLSMTVCIGCFLETNVRYYT